MGDRAEHVVAPHAPHAPMLASIGAWEHGVAKACTALPLVYGLCLCATILLNHAFPYGAFMSARLHASQHSSWQAAPAALLKGESAYRAGTSCVAVVAAMAVAAVGPSCVQSVQAHMSPAGLLPWCHR